MASAPNIDELRAWSDLDFASYGCAPGTDGDARLELQLSRAVMYLGYVTGRTYTQAQTDQFPLVKTAMDQAVQMRTEQVILALAADQLDSVADIDLIASFSAGAYSETRRDTVAEQQKMLNPWPTLNDLLWMLLGLFPGETNALVDERFDYWRALLLGINRPAWSVVEVDWGRGLGEGAAFPYGHNVLGDLVGPFPDENMVG